MLDNQEKALERKLLMVEDQLLIHMSVEVVVELQMFDWKKVTFGVNLFL